jgi:putative ABC transport system ATP-binding protein
MLKLKDVTKVHRADDVQTTALRNVSLEVAKGDFVAIMGPSGCGKSTLLNILGTLDTPTSGDYWIENENVAGYSEKQLAHVRRRHIGFIFQAYNLVDELTVRDNVELALLYRKTPPAARKTRVAEALERVGLSHRAGHRPSQLSGGQQQRVAVARAVVARPGLILADEPTGNLDTQHGVEVMEAIRGLNQDGATVVMVTHSPEHAAYARRTVRLLDGQITDDQAPPIVVSATVAKGAAP